MNEDQVIRNAIYGQLGGAPVSQEAQAMHALAAAAWAQATGQPAAAFHGVTETPSVPWADAVRAFMARPGVTAQHVAGWLVLRDAEGEAMPVSDAVWRFAAHRQAEAEGVPMLPPGPRW